MVYQHTPQADEGVETLLMSIVGVLWIWDTCCVHLSAATIHHPDAMGPHLSMPLSVFIHILLS